MEVHLDELQGKASVQNSRKDTDVSLTLGRKTLIGSFKDSLRKAKAGAKSTANSLWKDGDDDEDRAVGDLDLSVPTTTKAATLPRSVPGPKSPRKALSSIQRHLKPMRNHHGAMDTVRAMVKGPDSISDSESLNEPAPAPCLEEFPPKLLIQIDRGSFLHDVLNSPECNQAPFNEQWNDETALANTKLQTNTTNDESQQFRCGQNNMPRPIPINTPPPSFAKQSDACQLSTADRSSSSAKLQVMEDYKPQMPEGQLDPKQHFTDADVSLGSSLIEHQPTNCIVSRPSSIVSLTHLEGEDQPNPEEEMFERNIEVCGQATRAGVSRLQRLSSLNAMTELCHGSSMQSRSIESVSTTVDGRDGETTRPPANSRISSISLSTKKSRFKTVRLSIPKLHRCAREWSTRLPSPNSNWIKALRQRTALMEIQQRPPSFHEPPCSVDIGGRHVRTGTLQKRVVVRTMPNSRPSHGRCTKLQRIRNVKASSGPSSFAIEIRLPTCWLSWTYAVIGSDLKSISCQITPRIFARKMSFSVNDVCWLKTVNGGLKLHHPRLAARGARLRSKSSRESPLRHICIAEDESDSSSNGNLNTKSCQGSTDTETRPNISRSSSQTNIGRTNDLLAVVHTSHCDARRSDSQTHAPSFVLHNVLKTRDLYEGLAEIGNRRFESIPRFGARYKHSGLDSADLSRPLEGGTDCHNTAVAKPSLSLLRVDMVPTAAHAQESPVVLSAQSPSLSPLEVHHEKCSSNHIEMKHDKKRPATISSAAILSESHHTVKREAQQGECTASEFWTLTIEKEFSAETIRNLKNLGRRTKSISTSCASPVCIRSPENGCEKLKRKLPSRRDTSMSNFDSGELWL